MTITGNIISAEEGQLSYLNDDDRLQAFNVIKEGCKHLWSKNKPQWDRIKDELKNLAELAEKDPYFLAHLTSYAVKESDHKDLQVLTTFASSLSDADGTPVMTGSKYNKPNFRIIAQAALQHLDPKLALRVLTLARSKLEFGNKTKATHLSKHLRTGVKKYLKYRESNPKALENLYKSGWKPTIQKLYRGSRYAPSDETAKALRWKQKKWTEKKELRGTVFDFKGLSDLEVAEKIKQENLKALPALGALDRKVSPVIAVAIMEQATPDQAVVLTSLFEEEGLLKDNEVKKVYSDKIVKAKTTLDRVDRLNTIASEETKKIMKAAKATKRKEDIGDLGKVFIHIDNSPSMHQAVEVAKESGSIIAECIKNPEANFNWGLFNDRGIILQRPQTFEKDAFVHALYGVRCSGYSTNCLALYEHARKLGCDTDIYITDNQHNNGNMAHFIERARDRGYSDPKRVVVISVGNVAYRNQNGKRVPYMVGVFESMGIPVVDLKPDQLTESALVTQAIKSALLGQNAVLDQILATPLLTLPKWWESV